MRRVPAFVWILAPMALAILYAFVHPWLAPRPTLETVVPAEAILTHRYRNQAALDAGWFGAVDPRCAPRRRSAPDETSPSCRASIPSARSISSSCRVRSGRIRR